MMIAIPSEDDRGLDGYISEHFGRAPYYVFVEVDRGEIVNVIVERAQFVDHGPGEIPRYLKERGVDVVIAGGMGWRAREWFERLGIKVITGVSGKIKDIVDAYLRGEL